MQNMQKRTKIKISSIRPKTWKNARYMTVYLYLRPLLDRIIKDIIINVFKAEGKPLTYSLTSLERTAHIS